MRYRLSAAGEFPNDVAIPENEYPVIGIWLVVIEELLIEGRRGGMIIQSGNRSPRIGLNASLR